MHGKTHEDGMQVGERRAGWEAPGSRAGGWVAGQEARDHHPGGQEPLRVPRPSGRCRQGAPRPRCPRPRGQSTRPERRAAGAADPVTDPLCQVNDVLPGLRGNGPPPQSCLRFLSSQTRAAQEWAVPPPLCSEPAPTRATRVQSCTSPGPTSPGDTIGRAPGGSHATPQTRQAGPEGGRAVPTLSGARVGARGHL